MPRYTNTTYLDFLLNTSDKTIDELLADCDTPSERGHVWQALWKISLYLGTVPGYENIEPIISNLNKGPVITITNYDDEFLKKKIIEGNSSGMADIPFLKGNDCYLPSSKYFADPGSKSLADHGLNELDTLAHTEVLRARESWYILFVPDAKVFDETLRNAHTRHLYEGRIDNVFDTDDLRKCWGEVQVILADLKYDSKEILQFLGKGKEVFILRFHQELSLIKTDELPGYDPIIWGLKCRSGKQWMCGGHILRNGFRNVLIITPIPSETMSQIDDMFYLYRDFQKHNVHHLRGQNIPINPEGYNVFLTSKQYLQHHLDLLTKTHLDCIYFDENFFGGTTKKSVTMVNSYRRRDTKLILMGATYEKSRRGWKVPLERCIDWTSEDEKLCKLNDTQSLVERHGKHVIPLLPKYDLRKGYAHVPDLCIQTVLHDKDFIKRFNESQSHDDAYSFDIDELFGLTLKGDRFRHARRVNDFLDYHLGNGVNYGKNTIDRIEKAARDCGSRTADDFYDQLWFLPMGSGGLDQTSELLKQSIEVHPKGKKWQVVIINSKRSEYKAKRLRNHIEAEERAALREGKRGLIILAGGQAQMGISLKRVDVVVLLHNSTSADKLYQQMHRAGTEDSGKKKAFVVDYNSKRVLQLAELLVPRKRGESKRQHLRRICEIIDIDPDIMRGKDTTFIINKMEKMWKEVIIGSYTGFERGIANLIPIEAEEEFGSEFARHTGHWSSDDSIWGPRRFEVVGKDEKPKDAVKQVESLQEVDSSQDVEQDRDISSGLDIAEEESERQSRYVAEVLHAVVVISLFLTLNDDEYDLGRMLDRILSDTVRREAFLDYCDRCLGGIKPDSFIECVRRSYNSLVSTKYDKGLELREMIEGRKVKLRTTKRKKDLVEDINRMMKPKPVEKKMYGEVFTPLSLIEEMLDKLPVEIWSDKRLTVFDACVGTGNFLICVFDRLMEGLKEQIRDEQERRDHIIHNMLWMSELSAKNVYICKHILGEDCNIHHGDTLQLDTKEEWGLSEFGLIVGNPPYQPAVKRGKQLGTGEGGSGSGFTIWDKWVDRYLDWLRPNGYMCLVHPANWRKPLGGSKRMDKLAKRMRRKQFLYLEIHNKQDGDKTFRATTRYDWYVLKNTNASSLTVVKDELGQEHQLDISNMHFVPNFGFDTLDQVLARDGEEKCTILFISGAYRPHLKHMSKIKEGEFVYPVVNATTKNEVKLVWSNTQDRGLFGIPKVIFSDADTVQNAVLDLHGEYAMTQHAMAIPIASEREAKQMKRALESKRFNTFLKACRWSQFQIDYRMFRFFRKGFWQEFLGG